MDLKNKEMINESKEITEPADTTETTDQNIEQNTDQNIDQNIDPNIEDTARLMTAYKKGSSKKRMALIIAVLIAVAAVAGIGGFFAVNSKNYDKQLVIAEKALREGDYEQAETAYLSAVSMNKRKPKAREGLAFTYAVVGKFDESKTEYESLYADTGDEKYKLAAADAGEERIPGDSSLAISGVWRDIALEDIPEYDELYEFLRQFYLFSYGIDGGNDFDCNDASDSWVLLSLAADDLVDFSKYEDLGYYDDLYDEEHHKPDPRGWCEDNYYMTDDGETIYMFSERRADAVDWVAKNIMNLTDEDIASILKKEEEKGNLYREGDYYYSPMVRTGIGLCGIILLSAKTDGEKYCIEYESGMEGDYDEDGDYSYLDPDDPNYQHDYALMELKTIEGGKYWSMYYAGRKLPHEVGDQSFRQKESKDSKQESIKDSGKDSGSGSNLFEELSDVDFIFASGAGGWSTELNIDEDGSFTGSYHDSEMGLTGDSYPNGTEYTCSFSGQFSEPEKISDHVYRFNLKKLEHDEAEQEYIDDGTKYITADAYGIEDAKTIELYLPGADASDLPNGFTDWMKGVCSDDEYKPTLKIYGLYNIEEETGFAGRK